MKIRVGSILDLSTIDWPGHRTSMLFCGGCNFRCPFCMNTSLIPRDSGGEVDLDFIEKRILSNIGFLDAIGVTGGEPGLQPEPIIALFNWAKKRGISTFLNTNGSNSEFVSGLLADNLLDHIAIDIKAPLTPEAYGKVIGLQENIKMITTNINHSFEMCLKADLSVEIRTTIVPTLIDDECSIRNIANIAKKCGVYVLQQYFPFEEVLDEKLRTIRPPSRSVLFELGRAALDEGVREVYIRTKENGMEKVG